MRVEIEILDQDVALCKRFASFRRTLEEAMRLLPPGGDEANFCYDELEAIVPTIERLQMAIRAAK